METQSGTPNLVGSDVIAALFGVTARRVQQLTNDGIILSKKVKGANKYELLPTIQRYIKYLSEKCNTKADQIDKEVEDRKNKADADLKETRAKRSLLQLKELESKMHRSEDVEAAMTDLVYTIRSMLVALPGRLAVDTFNAKSAAEASEVIRLEINAILLALTGYRYDPEEYAKKVRERQGWQENNADDIDE